MGQTLTVIAREDGRTTQEFARPLRSRRFVQSRAAFWHGDVFLPIGGVLTIG
jgi:hypothetical protein